MLIYSIMMFFMAILFFIISVLIYRGKTDLIHGYHQTKVTDQVGYGKAFGKALSVFGVAMFISGVMGLIQDSDAIAMVAAGVLVIGLVIGTACIVAVQKKYNQGIF